MKITPQPSSGNMDAGDTRRQPDDTSSTSPSAGRITNVSEADNSPVMMNLPALADRGSRADVLIEMASEDGKNSAVGDRASMLSTEVRRTKMKG